jgi:hypothetical protein
MWGCSNVDMFMGFDIVGLCCHIDEEHPMEAKNGVCMTTFVCLMLFFQPAYKVSVLGLW